MPDRTPSSPSAFQRLRLNQPALKVRSFLAFRRLPALAVAAALLFEGVAPAWAMARDLAAWRSRTPDASMPATPAPAPAPASMARVEPSPAGPSHGIPGVRDLNALTTLPEAYLHPLEPVVPPPAGTLDVRGYYQSSDVKMTLYQNGDEVWGEWNWIRGYYTTGLPKRLKGRLHGNVLSADWEAMDLAAPSDHGVMALTFTADDTGGAAASLTGSWGSMDYGTYSTFTAAKAAAGVKLKVLPESRTLAPGATQTFTAYVSNAANAAVTWTADGGSITAEGLYTAPATPGVYTLIATSVADPSVWTPVSVVVPVASGIADYSGVYGEASTTRIYLWQSGDAIVGDWPYYNRQVAGTLTGSVFTGRWQSHANPADYGQITFTFATTSTGYTLAGTWGTGASSTGNTLSFARTQNGVTLAVSPHMASVAPGQPLKLQALVSGHAWQGVRWTATGGTVDGAGIFTCATPGNYTVTATSVANPAKSASAEVWVTGDAPLDVSGTWGTDPVVFFQAGSALWGIRNRYNDRFKCVLTGSAMAGQFFYINPPGALRGTVQGTFSGNSFTGTWTAGASSGPWNLTRAAGVAGVYIPTRPVPLAPGSSHLFTALVSGVADKSVTWSASAGSIDASGLFTAPASAGVVLITAASVADPTKTCVRLVSVGSGASVDPAPPVSGYYTGNERGWSSQTLYPTQLNLFQDGLLVWGTFHSTARFNSTNTVKGLLNGRYLQATFALGSATSYPYYFGITLNPDTGAYVGGTGSNGAVTSNYEWTGSRNAATVSLGTDAYYAPTVPGGTVKLNAFTGGPGDRSLTWSASAGSVAPDGTFTAPSSEGASTVTATSVLDPGKSLTFTVEALPASGTPDLSGVYTATQDLKLFQSGNTFYGEWNSGLSAVGTGPKTLTGFYANRVLAGTAVGTATHPMSIGFAPGFQAFKGTVNATAWQGTKRAGEVVVAVTPSASTVLPGQAQPLLAMVAGAANKAVTWSATGGSVTANGIYTAPALAGTYAVTATSVADPAKSATATVTVPVAISLAPEYAETRPGGSVQLRATVTGSANTNVTWTITEAGGGSITPAGLYTAPATEGTYHLTATAAADTTKKAYATVKVTSGAAVTVTVTPYATQLNKNGTATFTATVEGTNVATVTWTASAGTIDATGNYTAPNAFGTYTVTATSTLDPSAYGVATVVVSAQSGTDKAFTYDENGNMTSDGERTFEWDAENRLMAVVKGTHRSEFLYDGLGRRVGIKEIENGAQQSDQEYLWEGVEIAEERDANGTAVSKRFYGQGFVDSDGTILYYTKDHLGSIRGLTDSAQVVRALYEYDPCGRMSKLSGDKVSQFGFTGHFWHSQSRLNLALFRAYDPDIARWLSRDPLGNWVNGSINIEMSESPNTYIYCLNKPINYFDELGLECKLVYHRIERTSREKEVREVATWEKMTASASQWLLGVLIGGWKGNIAGICNFKFTELWERYKTHVSQKWKCKSCKGTVEKTIEEWDEKPWHVTEKYVHVQCIDGPNSRSFNIGGVSPPDVSGFGSR